jgi:protoheme IX farnesyltransferase
MMVTRTPPTAATAARRRVAVPARVRLLLGLFKLRIGVVIAITALAGAALQPGAALTWIQGLTLFVGTLLAAASAGAFNQYYEVDLDARMRRTRMRPFVSGRLAHRPWWPPLILLIGLVGVVACAVVLNALAAVFTFLGAFFYGVVYTVWLKRRTWWNIVVGGAAGSFAVLAGAAAVAPQMSVQAWLFAAVLFLWTPPHFWSLAIVCRDDYAAAGVPMLPVVKGTATAARVILAHTLVLVLVSWLVLAWAPGWFYGVGALAGGLYFSAAAWRLARAPTPDHARRCFKASLVQLSLLLVGALLDAALLG